MRTIQGCSRRIAGRLWLGVVLLLLILGTAVVAAARLSANYNVPIDAVAGAGGASQSVSYRQPESASGPISSASQSASYRMRAGVVQSPESKSEESPSAVQDWQQVN